MAILKLSPTQPHTITVSAARIVAGQYGEQVAFDTENGDTLFVSANTAERQLGRIGLDVETVVGETLHFEQVKKDSKTFTNINKARGGAAPASSTAHNTRGVLPFEGQDEDERRFVETVKQTPAAVDRWASLFSNYDRCMEYVLTVEVPKLKKAGVEPTNEGVSAMCSTLLIQASQKGIAA